MVAADEKRISVEVELSASREPADGSDDRPDDVASPIGPTMRAYPNQQPVPLAPKMM